MNHRETFRDAAGDLGIHEDDLEPVAPLVRDHGYFTLNRILGYVLASAVGAIVALVTVAILRAIQ